jgi:DNA helicase HerA-like ATPase
VISVDSLLSRHFAIVGTTGVGKSTSVALILRKIVEKRPDIRTLILDPHNEFATAFPESSVTVDASSLDLPFWMFTLEEFVEVIYRGRPGIGEEVDTLRDLIPEAKFVYENGTDANKATSLKKKGQESSSYTADTPVPYRMADLFKLIDNRLGLLDGKAERPHLRSLKNRIDLVMNDPRFSFMFNSQYGADAMARLLSLAFRIPQNNKPICVFELSGLPSEVVNVVASVMCRLAFDLGCSSHGTIQTLVVCEEAHRYIPADTQAGFLPTRLAISKIAKEGRKYGVFLGVITQRPGELDATILSQCSTIFSMRLGNEHDQAIVGKAISGAANSTVSFLSSLANRECIAFGEAMEAPMRMTFENVSAKKLPGSNIYENQAKLREGKASISLSSVIIKMRDLGTGSSKTLPEDINTIQRVDTAPADEQRQMSRPSNNNPHQVIEQSKLTNPLLPEGLQLDQRPLSEHVPTRNTVSRQMLNQSIRDGVSSDEIGNEPITPPSADQTSQNHSSMMPGKHNRVQLQQRMSVEPILTKSRNELNQPRNSSSSGLIRAFRPK